jgi:hypothetical protein
MVSFHDGEKGVWVKNPVGVVPEEFHLGDVP